MDLTPDQITKLNPTIQFNTNMYIDIIHFNTKITLCIHETFNQTSTNI